MSGQRTASSLATALVKSSRSATVCRLGGGRVAAGPSAAALSSRVLAGGGTGGDRRCLSRFSSTTLGSSLSTSSVRHTQGIPATPKDSRLLSTSDGPNAAAAAASTHASGSSSSSATIDHAPAAESKSTAAAASTVSAGGEASSSSTSPSPSPSSGGVDLPAVAHDESKINIGWMDGKWSRL